MFEQQFLSDIQAPISGVTIKDANGNEVLKCVKATSAVNEVSVTNAAASSGPSVAATGDDTNIDVTLKGKGTGSVIVGQATSTNVKLAADQPIADSSGNEFLAFVKTASAVNEVTITNQITAVAPKIAASGGDTNIGLRIAPKGTAAVMFTGQLLEQFTVNTVATNGAVTILAAAMLAGLYISTNTGAVTLTTDTGANLDAALPGCVTGDSFIFIIRNQGSNTVTLGQAATGITWATGNTNTVVTLHTRTFLALKTGTATWTIYALQDSAH